jgi:predicted kinase
MIGVSTMFEKVLKLCRSWVRPRRAIVLIGIPGSGKSTYSRDRFSGSEFEIHSTDAIRGELFGDENMQGDWSQIERLLKKRVAQTLRGRKIPIIDATHARKVHRVRAVGWLHSMGARVHGVYVATPLTVCQERNARRSRVVPEAVIDGMFRSLLEEPPSREDGFDSLETVIF